MSNFVYHRTKRRCKKQIVIIRHLTIQENSSKEKRGRKRSRKELWQCWEKRNNWESRRGFKAQRQDDTVNKLTSPHWMSPRRWVRILCSWCRRERERERKMVHQTTAIRKYFMWSLWAHESIFFYDMMSNAIYSSMHTVKTEAISLDMSQLQFPCHNF